MRLRPSEPHVNMTNITKAISVRRTIMSCLFSASLSYLILRSILFLKLTFEARGEEWGEIGMEERVDLIRFDRTSTATPLPPGKTKNKTEKARIKPASKLVKEPGKAPSIHVQENKP